MDTNALKSEVIEVLKRFQIAGWTNCTSDEIAVEPLGEGWINTTYIIDELPGGPKSDTDAAPARLVYKKYGGNKFSSVASENFAMNPPIVHSLVSFELSKRGWGPQLYGVTEHSRVEQYVDCHTLKATEAFSEEISSDLARAFARFHSLDLPLVKSAGDHLELMRVVFESSKNELINWLDSGVAPIECSESFKSLLLFPFADECKWVTSIIAKIDHRIVFAAMDPNYLNRLVKNRKPEDVDENRCVIIDFDVCRYFNRGYDFGGHFFMGAFFAERVDHLYSSYPTKKERTFFLSRYLEEFIKLSDDPQSIDNVDNLHLEADIYAVHFSLVYLLLNVNFYKLYQTDPYIHARIKPTIDLFYRLKENFLTNHPISSDIS